MVSPHRFAIGQTVEIVAGRQDAHVPRGMYTVTRQMPNDASDREYRVRHKAEGHERVVRESMMRAGPSTPFG